MTVNSYTVQGMTCGHCVASVTEEISEIPGVIEVAVDLDSGRVEITSNTPIDDAAVRTAVDEAGYELVAS